ncbi:MAG TPA: hypothetical protein VFG74_14395 [Miltoncostaeaceae bacterium]|jgi:mRNA-degrading endonuclease toxin of MazEF toxin-antitoxin module|nr:hypothetical protein [Miltoncostaeaceae bacterium]
MEVRRGEVRRAEVPFPPRGRAGDPEPLYKRVALLRTSGDVENDVPVVVLSTDRDPAGRPRAAYVVKVAAEPAWGTDAPTTIDCRWVYTLGKENLSDPLGVLPPEIMEQISEALVTGLSL